MNKASLVAFYLLQGLANLVYALFFIRFDVSYGGSGGVAVGLEALFRVILIVPSCLSLFAVLALVLRKGSYARSLGSVSSALFMSYYGLIAFSVLSSFAVRGQDGYEVFLFLVTAGIVVLNFVVLLLLHSVTEKNHTLA